jgi:hypothetical protein
MRIRLAILVAVIVLAFGAPARAHSHAGGAFKLMPVGTITAGIGSTDAAFAFAIQGFIDVEIVRYLYIGFAPQLILNVKGQDDTGSAGQELDLFARVMGRYPIASNVQLYGYLAPGFSVIFVPDKAPGFSNPTGFVLGFAGGVSYSITPRLFIAGELGYQWGFQSSGGTDFKTRYLQIGFVIGTMF